MWCLLNFTPIFDSGSCEQYQSGSIGIARCRSKQSYARATEGKEQPIRAKVSKQALPLVSQSRHDASR